MSWQLAPLVSGPLLRTRLWRCAFGVIHSVLGPEEQTLANWLKLCDRAKMKFKHMCTKCGSARRAQVSISFCVCVCVHAYMCGMSEWFLFGHIFFESLISSDSSPKGFGSPGLSTHWRFPAVLCSSPFLRHLLF